MKLEPTNQFKRDVKKRWNELISENWTTVAYCLINDLEIPEQYKDHELTGNFKGIRECHIKPDLLKRLHKLMHGAIMLKHANIGKLLPIKGRGKHGIT